MALAHGSIEHSASSPIGRTSSSARYWAAVCGAGLRQCMCGAKSVAAPTSS